MLFKENAGKLKTNSKTNEDYATKSKDYYLDYAKLVCGVLNIYTTYPYFLQNEGAHKFQIMAKEDRGGSISTWLRGELSGFYIFSWGSKGVVRSFSLGTATPLLYYFTKNLQRIFHISRIATNFTALGKIRLISR